MAINSNGTRLFVAAPNSSGAGKGQILVFNINPEDRPSNPTSNPRNWHQLIGKTEGGLRLEGISATPDPRQMLFTNRNEDARGLGVLSIISDDPANFAATVKYVQLTLGNFNDYFDINEAVAVTLTRDKKYAFVAARNGRLIGSGIESIDSPKAGSNIGIIKDPLGDNPKLVAATRPIPGGLTSDLALSSNDKYLYATYPGIKSTFGFNVEEIIKTVEQTNLDVLGSTPIDDINPAINMASDFRILSEDSSNGRVEFGVPPKSNRGPLANGEIPFSVAMAEANQVVKIVSPVDKSQEDRLKPTFEWEIYKPADDCEGDACNPEEEDPNKIEYVKLYLSVFDKDNGLLPDDWQPQNPVARVKDYNPNRILTAIWQNGQWKWEHNGQEIPNEPGLENTHKQFTLPDDRRLTAAQTYHWAVEVKFEGSKAEPPVVSEFKTSIPSATNGNTFSSVTVLTRGLELKANEADSQLNAIAKHIADVGDGLVMYYEHSSGKWYRETPAGGKDYTAPSDKYGKPLVLIPGWDSREENRWNSGFAEAAADNLFASVVSLDQLLRGGVGSGDQLYDPQGQLIRKPGAVFQSPLHFVGFGQGAAINSEFVQRLGTFFPNTYDGSRSGTKSDLHMTTIDAFDPTQTKFINPRNLFDPEVKIWENVTFADNYYQKATFDSEKISSGISIPQSDWNVFLGEIGNPEALPYLW